MWNQLEFHQVINKLEAHALTEGAKRRIRDLQPFLSELELKHAIRETTQARQILDQMGIPPLVRLKQEKEILQMIEMGGCLSPEQLEYMASILTTVRRLKDFLNRGKVLQLSLSYYEEQLKELQEVSEEITNKIRSGNVDDCASRLLRNLRQEVQRLDEKMRAKADSTLKSKKEYLSEGFVTQRNGRLCLPVKAGYQNKIAGSVIDKSSTGATVFVEPSGVAQLFDELVIRRMETENEERRILYELTNLIYEEKEAFYENARIMEKLDYAFAKGKLSVEMDGVEPVIHTERLIQIKNGRHPFLEKENCVPLNFKIGDGVTGVVITGPNTGGKTVAIKTVGLLSLMAQSGLHVPCEEGIFTMNNQVLSDIGDGQNITENLSTFSAHITTVLDILSKVNQDSLVIMDELGSGTDPAEGMGIAVAILEELRKSGCLFLVTTHYPEVKAYASKAEGVINARMAFDRESLKPLYRLEIGAAGDSCAFYIARHLGMPEHMLKVAGMAAYSTDIGSLAMQEPERAMKKRAVPKIEKQKTRQVGADMVSLYAMGDSVMVSPERKIAIVCKPVNEQGMLQIQLSDEKVWVSHKRVKLHVKAAQMYPEDYDFSIVFDSVEVRKARHKMDRKYSGNVEVKVEE